MKDIIEKYYNKADTQPNRIWYPEVVELLTEKWNDEATNDELIALAKLLTKKVREIKQTIPSEDLIVKCPECGKKHPIDTAVVRIPSLITAALRFSVCSTKTRIKLNDSWSKYQKQHNLSLAGLPKKQAC